MVPSPSKAACWSQWIFTCPSLGHLDDEVQKRAVDSRELMGNAVRDDDDIPLGEVVLRSAHDRRGMEFMRADRLGVHRSPAGDESRRSVHNVENVRIAFMDFHGAGGDAPSGENLVEAVDMQSAAGRESLVDLEMIEDDDVGGWRRGRPRVGGGRGANQPQEGAGDKGK